ncbi:MAG: hypothetical protein NTW44_03205 [Nitrospirae bacterium]|nr:hypothetical protein [Nitrospirota bacterium]
MKKLIIVLALLLLVPAYALGVEINQSVVSTQTNLRELMEDTLSQMQRLLAGVIYQNTYEAGQAAIAIAAHPLPASGAPKAGVGYFIAPEHRLAVLKALPTFKDAVHGPALELDAAAKKGDWDLALQKFHDILNGCNACHKVAKPLTIDNVILERNKDEISKMKKTIVK